MKRLSRIKALAVLVCFLLYMMSSLVVWADQYDLKLEVQSLITDQYTDQIKPLFKITNNGSIPVQMKDVKIKYYFTFDFCSPIEVELVGFKLNGKSNVKTVDFSMITGLSLDRADTYLEIDFSRTETLKPGENAELEVLIRDGNNNKQFNQLNDYSFKNDFDLSTWKKTPLYYGGELIIGQEPNQAVQNTKKSTPVPTLRPVKDNSVLPNVNGLANGPEDRIDFNKKVTIDYLQQGEFNIASVPTEKDVYFILDSSFSMTANNSPQLAPFKYVLFSRSDSYFLGGKSVIEGDIFTRDNFDIISSGLQVDGVYEYYNLKQPWMKIEDKNGNPATSVKLTDDSGQPNSRDKYDYLFGDDSNANDFGQYNKFFNDILDNSMKVDPTKFPAYFPNSEEDLKALYYSSDPSKNRFYKKGDECEVVIDPKGGESEKIYVRYRKDPNTGKGEFMLVGGSTFNIMSDMYFDGNVTISVPDIDEKLIGGLESAFILGTGNVKLQGQKLKSGRNIYVASLRGNIDIETSTTGKESAFTGMAFAPRGEVTIKGMEGSNYAGYFIGKSLRITNTSTFKQPDKSIFDKIANRFEINYSLQTVKSSLIKMVNNLPENTRAGAIQYSSNSNNADFNLYDMGEADQKQGLIDCINDLKPDGNEKQSNLGDALRRAYYNMKNSGVDRDKHIIIFTGKKPDTSTVDSEALGLSKDNLFTEDGDAINSYKDDSMAGDYVGYFIDLFKQYDIGVQFIDLSKCNGSSVNLKAFSDNAGIVENYHYPIDISDLENVVSKKVIDNILVTRSILKIKNLQLKKDLIFETILPQSFEPKELIFEGEKISEDDGSGTGWSIINGNVRKLVFNIPKNKVRINPVGEGEISKYSLEQIKVSVNGVVNSVEPGIKVRDITDLHKEWEIDVGPSKIIYEFEDGINDMYEIDPIEIPFNDVTIKLEYYIDLT